MNFGRDRWAGWNSRTRWPAERTCFLSSGVVLCHHRYRCEDYCSVLPPFKAAGLPRIALAERDLATLAHDFNLDALISSDGRILHAFVLHANVPYATSGSAQTKIRNLRGGNDARRKAWKTQTLSFPPSLRA
jgi:hypothetical protein